MDQGGSSSERNNVSMRSNDESERNEREREREGYENPTISKYEFLRMAEIKKKKNYKNWY